MTPSLQLTLARGIGVKPALKSSTALAGSVGLRGLLASLSVGIGLIGMGGAAYALPTGGVVAAGAASLSSTGSKLTVTQTSQNAVLNFQSFSVGAGQAVQFVQPNSASVALNRVLGADPSVILGSLSANGRVFLVNPNGILFAKGAQVNVGGLAASTLDITDADFMASVYKFSGTSANAVLNQGAITAASGGYVAFLGANVSNQGAIVANLGSVVLAGGRAVTLDLAADGLLNVVVDQGAVAALAQNGGLIRADGGQVLMTTQAAGVLLHTVVNNTGVIEARSIGGRDGRISLLGDAGSGVVTVSGTLDASGTGAGQAGGAILATGHAVDLSSATLTASGDQGGGSVLIGGGYQGKTAAIANAATVTMASDVSITADALSAGRGGQVVLWSQGLTSALGAISARGGALSGDGGLVETSGETVQTGAATAVDTLAPKGATGLWLLDPVNYTIATNGGDETPAQVTTSLASSNRLITASNDITVADAITWTTPQTLTLNAGHDVLINAAITASTAGSEIDLVAGHNVEIDGALTASGNGSHVDVYAGQDIDVNQAVTASGGGAILFVADSDGSGGLTGGAVYLNPLFDVVSTSKTIYYSPPGGYGDPTLYTGFNAFMWVFVAANNKVYDGTDTATATFRGDPTVAGTKDVSLTGGTIAFEDPNVGTVKAVDYNNYSLLGADKGLYALYPNQAAVVAAQSATAMITATAVASGVTAAAITPAPLTIQADNASKIYGQSITLPGTAFTSAGLVNEETIGSVNETSPGAAATASVAGSAYAITPTNATGGSFKLSNYTVTYINGALTVTPATLVITADSVVKTYGQSVTLAGTAYTAAGLVNGDTIGAVTETSAGAAPTAGVLGTPYAITAAGAVGGSYTPANYAISYVSGSLTVTPATLILTADNATKPYGDTLTFSGAAFTATGLQNGETVGTVTETSSGAAAAATTGLYAIDASGAAGGTYTPANYVTTYVAGTLAVSPGGPASPGGPTSPGTPGAPASPAGPTSPETPPSAVFTVPQAASPGVTPTGVGALAETSSQATAAESIASGAASGEAGLAMGMGGGAGLGAPQGAAFAVVDQGVRMPAAQMAEVEQAQAVSSRPQLAEAAVAAAPVAAPRAAYAAPAYAPKQDRN
jgi:filamentous hemagglutinin family protein